MYAYSNGDGGILPRDMNSKYCEDMGDGNMACYDVWMPGEVVEVNNYYPFGLMHNYTATTMNSYQYKYNGKELQETGMYDYGARFYMPDIGRWGVVDPLAEKYISLTPYNYTLNNPIRYVDPDGRDGGVTGTGTIDDPFIVTANYYHFGLTKDQKKGLAASISKYNNNGAAREINTEGGKIYAIFKLSATESPSMDAAIASAKADKVENSDGTVTRLGNYISNGTVTEDGTAHADRQSIVSDATKVMAIEGLDYASKFENDFNHEIGHNLGGVHGDPGGMMDDTDKIKVTTSKSKVITTMTGSPITNDALRAIIGRTDMTALTPKGNVSGYGVVDSKYITAEEKKQITGVSNGRLKSIK